MQLIILNKMEEEYLNTNNKINKNQLNNENEAEPHQINEMDTTNRMDFAASDSEPDENAEPYKKHVKDRPKSKHAHCNFMKCKSCNPETAFNQIAVKPKSISTTNTRVPRVKWCKLSCKYCNRILDKIDQELYQRAVDTINQQNGDTLPPNPNMTKPSISNEERKMVLEKKPDLTHLQSIDISDYTSINVPADGNCVYRSMLESAYIPQEFHPELRKAVADIVDNNPLPEGSYGTYTKDQYTSLIRQNYKFVGYLEMQALAATADIWIAVYLEDSRYSNLVDKWQIIKNNENDQRPKAICYLLTSQGTDPITGHDQTSHFKALVPKTQPQNTSVTTIHKAFVDLLQINLDPHSERTNHKILLWNARSLQDNTKKLFLTDILRQNQVVIAVIAETFLLCEDKMYIQGYRVYRANNTTRRKGVAILINSRLKAKITITTADQNGRFLKLKLTNPETRQSISVAGVYLEPSNEDNIGLIDESIWSSDFILGDMNNCPTGCQRHGVYHTKGLAENVTINSIPKKLSDHGYISSSIKIPLSLNTSESRARTTDINIARTNENTLFESVIDIEKAKNSIFRNPEKTLTRKHDIVEPSDPMLYEQWLEIKQANKSLLEIETTEKLRTANTLIARGILSKAAWLKVNSTLLVKKSMRLYKNENHHETTEIANGFRQLYKDKNVKKLFNWKHIYEKIIQVLNISPSQKQYLLTLPSISAPYSRARDFNGFSQRSIITKIKGDNAWEDLERWLHVVNTAAQVNNQSLFFHNIANIILFLKKEYPESWADYRPISILPVAIIVTEKVTVALIKQYVGRVITINQFAARDHSDSNLAKLKLFYNMTKKNLNKCLFIDVKKAYDSVSYNTLTNIARDTFKENQEALKLIEAMISLYGVIRLNIYDQVIDPECGLPQGSVWAMFLFVLYIQNIIVDITKAHPTIEIQAFVDDIVLQSNEHNNIQSALNTFFKSASELNLELNPSKCEYLSNDDNEKITFINDFTLNPSPIAKYMGQYFDTHGNPTAVITNKTFGKIISILSSTTPLTRLSKVLLFQAYVRSRVAHMLPIITLANKIEPVWQTLRRIIFRYIINYATLPRESAALFGIGYYDVIIKPLLKLIKRDLEVNQDNDQHLFLVEASISAFTSWLTFEPNLTQKVKSKIAEVLEKKSYPDYTEWDRLVKVEAAQRLLRNTPNIPDFTKIAKLTQPTIILFLSNAPAHEITQRTKYIISSQDEASRNNEEVKIFGLIKTYVTVNHLMKESNEYICDETNGDDLNQALESAIVREVTFTTLIRQLDDIITPIAQNITNKQIHHNETRDLRTDVGLCPDLVDTITSYRALITNKTKREWRNIELAHLILEDDPSLKQISISKNKTKGPGRPPLLKADDPKPNQKKPQTNNTTLDQFGFKKH